jgi:DNA helicase-2/ATP-dependent DNA helicase PcrA
MDKLVLTYAKRRMKFGEMSSQMMSSFIREIPAKYLNQAKKTPKPQFAGTGNIPAGLFANKNNKNLPLKDRFSAPPKNVYSQVSDFDNYSQVHSEIDFNVGDIVSHSQFGTGKICSLKGEGPRRQAVVRFDSIGRKMLMLKYAKLKLIKKVNQI